jgi:glycosyltransferase involved in cell wall biosynthesis
VSVIIPTHNYGRFISMAVESVLGQTHRNVETIVVDDGSTGGTSALIARRFGGRVRLLTQKQAGASVARNHGLRMATGDFLALLDADDLYAPTCLARKLEVLDANPDIGWVYSRPHWVDEGGHVVSVNDTPAKALLSHSGLSGRVLEPLLGGMRLQTSDLFFRSRCYAEIGEFDEELTPYEDYEFALRLADAFPIGFVDEPLYTYRLHGDSLSRQRTMGYTARGKLIRLIEARYGPYLNRPAVCPGWNRFKADWLNYEGKRLYGTGAFRASRNCFAESIRRVPCQRGAYLWWVRAGGRGLIQRVMGDTTDARRVL